MVSTKSISYDNPRIDLLLAAEPKVDPTKIPEDYLGDETDENLIALLAEALQDSTLLEINTIDTSLIPESMKTGKARFFAKTYLRFIKDASLLPLYFSFVNVYGKKTLTNEQTYYVVRLLAHFRDKAKRGLVNVITSARASNEEYILEQDRHDPTIPELDNYFALQRFMKEEGLVIDTKSLWVCSTHWTPEEVIELIAEGMEIRKAVELYTMGFSSVEEIIHNQNTFPEEWINRILGRYR